MVVLWVFLAVPMMIRYLKKDMSPEATVIVYSGFYLLWYILTAFMRLDFAARFLVAVAMPAIYVQGLF